MVARTFEIQSLESVMSHLVAFGGAVGGDVFHVVLDIDLGATAANGGPGGGGALGGWGGRLCNGRLPDDRFDFRQVRLMFGFGRRGRELRKFHLCGGALNERLKGSRCILSRFLEQVVAKVAFGEGFLGPHEFIRRHVPDGEPAAGGSSSVRTACVECGTFPPQVWILAFDGFQSPVPGRLGLILLFGIAGGIHDGTNVARNRERTCRCGNENLLQFPKRAAKNLGRNIGERFKP